MSNPLFSNMDAKDSIIDTTNEDMHCIIFDLNSKILIL